MHKLSFKKKVLLVSNFAPPTAGGSPHVLWNLMSCFEPDSYALYTHIKNLSAGDLTKKLPCTYYTYAPAGKGNRFFSPIRQFAALICTVANGVRIIKRENVGVLVGTADRGTALLLTLGLSILTKRPYVLYMLDPYRGNDFPPVRQFFARMLEPIFFKHATTVITTNKSHRALYERQYGKRFRYAILYHASPVPERVPSSVTPLRAPPHTVLYSGSIYGAQDRSIRNLIRAIEAMPELDIKLLLYVPKRMEHMIKAYASHSCVEIHTAAREDIRVVQEKASILFLPLSWVLSEEVLSMAIPGKTPEYLLAGRPILVHAPPQAVISEYAREEGFGYVVDTEEPAALEEGLKKLLTDRAYVETLVAHARATFEEHHRQDMCAAAFKRIVDDARTSS